MEFTGKLIIELDTAELENSTGDKTKYIPVEKVKIFSYNKKENTYQLIPRISKLKIEVDSQLSEALVEATILKKDSKFKEKLNEALKKEDLTQVTKIQARIKKLKETP